MIAKLLIANRGEIAARVIRTARRLGIRTVAVHSEADARALHVAQADERVAIGPAAAGDSYLKIDHIIRAAHETGADAVHPGYGFLSESAAFADACRNEGLLFVGPRTETIKAMGCKLQARASADAAGVPVIPGSGNLTTLEEATSAAARIGYPLLLKASAGGGGIGMQPVANAEELGRHFLGLRSLAGSCFGDDSVYMERALEAPRHVEVQIAGDTHGHVIHIGERECSIQRRHQQVMEETPSPGIDADLRERMTAAAIRLAEHVGYSSLGSVEMLVVGGEFYFLEMNTRLQIEHTVTEMVTGLDLVEWQIRVALGEVLPATQSEICSSGHAIQCRICAEDPDNDFEPSPGRIDRFVVPAGPWVRNDVGVYQGDYVTPFYDPLIAKLVVHGQDRQQAIRRLAEALDAYEIGGLTTNLKMHRRITADPAFQAGELSTGFLRQHLGFRA